MSRRMDFAQYCQIANALAPHSKRANEGGLQGLLQGLSPTAMGALAGGAGGLITGAFSDQPGSMLRHGLIGAGLGAGVGYGAPKLMDYLAQQKNTGTPGAAPEKEPNQLLEAYNAPQSPKPPVGEPTKAPQPWSEATAPPADRAGAATVRDTSAWDSNGNGTPNTLERTPAIAKSLGETAAKTRNQQGDTLGNALARFGFQDLVSNPGAATHGQLAKMSPQVRQVFEEFKKRQASPSPAAPSPAAQAWAQKVIGAGDAASGAASSVVNFPGDLMRSRAALGEAKATSQGLQDREAAMLLQSLQNQ